MKLLICPTHQLLSAYCAETIINRHAELLPDLTRLTLLTPNATSAVAFRRALLLEAQKRDFTGLILPDIQPLRTWVQTSQDAPKAESSLSELLDLWQALRTSPHVLNQSNPWATARELLTLFEGLWLSDDYFLQDEDQMTARLQQAYGIPDSSSVKFRNETHVVHNLWRAWEAGSKELLSSSQQYREALRKVPEAVETEALYLCGYERLMPAEIQALQQISRNIPVTCLTRPRHYIRSDLPVEEISAAPSPYAYALEQAFNLGSEENLRKRAQACRKIYPQSPLSGRLHFFAAEQAEPHASAITLQIRRWIHEKRQNIGLVTEDRKLARRIRALLERHDIYVNDFAGWALSTTSVAGVIVHWLDCLDQDFYYRVMLDVLKSPFVKFKNIKPHHLKQVKELETLLHRNHTSQGWAHYECLATQKPELQNLLRAVNQAAEPLTTLRSNPTGPEYITALLKSLDRLGCIASFSDDEAGRQVLEKLEAIRFQLTDNTANLPKHQWRSIICHFLENQDFRPETSQPGVSLINLNQSHMAQFDYLIVAGMDARHYPHTSSSFIFNDTVRKDLGLPTEAEQRELDLQRFSALLMSTEKVLMTYQKNEEDEPLLPSTWWTQIKVFNKLAYKKPLDDQWLPSMLSWQTNESLYPPQKAPRPDSVQSMPQPAACADLLPEKISARAHQDLIHCPYRFYVHYMLDIRKIDTIREEMNPADFGNFVHRCLEAFHKDVPGLPGPWEKPITGNEGDALDTLEKIGRHSIERHDDNLPRKVFLERWRQISRRYLEMQKNIETERSIVEVENKSERDLGGLTLHGRIDRIDQTRNSNKIVIDYKTGSTPIKNPEIQAGEDVQLISYTLIHDAIDQVEYWWLNSSNTYTSHERTTLSNKTLLDVRNKVCDRLLSLYQRLQENASLPANGSQEACKYCDAKGICRKDVWQDQDQTIKQAGITIETKTATLP